MVEPCSCAWLFNPGMREIRCGESDRFAAAGEPFVWRYRVPRESSKEMRFHDGMYGDQSKEAAERAIERLSKV